MARYLRFHRPRFDYVLELLARQIRPGDRLLDIGWSQLSNEIHQACGVTVDALGFDADGPIPSGRYYHFDLNDCQSPHLCRRDLPAYDVIVFAEVLEHVHTSPALVLTYLSDLLKPGGILLVQTPNAVALPRRLKMLAGCNPFELIREDASNPGHFREYTAAELRRYADQVGLTVEAMTFRSYFDYRFAHADKSVTGGKLVGRLKNLVYPLLPGSFRPGLTAILRRPCAASQAA